MKNAHNKQLSAQIERKARRAPQLPNIMPFVTNVNISS